MKTVYFVRHGESEGNQEDVYQFDHLGLSERGKKQAAFLAKRAASISFDALLSSPLARAKETAEAISSATNHPIIEVPEFRELVRPTAMLGKAKSSPEMVKLLKEVMGYFPHKGQHHSDEENFHDLVERGTKALQILIDRPELTLLVVTHGNFLRILMTMMLAKEHATADLYTDVYSFFAASNTGITECRYTNAGTWQLRTWNDHAHLGEIS